MVAEVTMERVHRTGFPKTICGVVYQPGAFSWTHDGRSDRPADINAWLEAQAVADEVLLYGCTLCTGATHYHTIDSHPDWIKDMDFIGVWGNHVFYARKGDDE
jgi:spore germination cell wall hydrolase CwlJ-like protein